MNLKGLMNIRNSELERIFDMARINKSETNGLFPYNSWEIKMWSNDHKPAHVHIMKDGWNVTFLIEDGSLDKIEREGSKKADFDYMCKNINKWFDNLSADAKGRMTNREYALTLWDAIHEND